jgi:tetratricopeptide (TPR) repeat protein
LLGVATVLEGQVQRAGNRLRINVQLIDTKAEGHIWANTYDRELTAKNVFDLQSDIARTIADALHAEISPAGQKLLDAVPTRNTEALEQYLLGVQHWNRQSYGSLQSAIAYLTRATELDPQYAEAWVALASAFTSAFQTGAMNRDEYVRGAERAIRKALDLNPRLGPAHAQQALLQWTLGDLPGAEASFLQALELDPHNSNAIGEYAYFLRGELRPEEAIPLLEKQLVDDPLSTELLFQLGKAEMHAGRPERFIEIARRIREINPSIVHGYTGTMQAYMWMGRLDRGIEWFARTLAVDPLDYENWAHAALTNEQLGAHELADRYMRRAEEIGPGRPSVLKCRAQIHVNRGEDEAALEIARHALSNNLDDRWGSDLTFLRIVRDAALDAGDVEEVIGLYRDRAPGAFADKPEITVDNVGYAVDAILPLQYAGEHEAASRIIDAAMDWYDRHNPSRIYGYDTFIMDAELFALKGQEDLAIERLRDAIDSGWALNWQAFVLGRNLESLEQHQDYQSLVARLESKMNEQLDSWLSAPHAGDADLRDRPAR